MGGSPKLRRMSNEKPVLTIAETGPAEPEPFYIPATEPTTRPRRTMKHGDCFVMLDSYGDVGAAHGGPDGFFYIDTRYLSHLGACLSIRRILLVREGRVRFCLGHEQDIPPVEDR